MQEQKLEVMLILRRAEMMEEIPRSGILGQDNMDLGGSRGVLYWEYMAYRFARDRSRPVAAGFVVESGKRQTSKVRFTPSSA